MLIFYIFANLFSLTNKSLNTIRTNSGETQFCTLLCQLQINNFKLL